MAKLRVLQGVTGQAGQPDAIARGLREIGIHAETCSITEHKFGYKFDRFCDLSDARNLTQIYQKLQPLIEDFDVFHFHARSFLASWPQVEFPTGLDILLLKLHGKKIYFHYRGQEIRLAEQFAEKNPFHYVDEPSGYLFKKMPDASKLRLRDFIGGLADGIFVNDPEIQTYVPGSIVIPRALDAADWPDVGVSDRSKPLIVHAPSRRGVKGTEFIIAAAVELQREGLEFDLQLVENLSHEEAAACYKQADIIVDQLRIGWYGVLAVEGMALGKPVVAYIRDDLWEQNKDSLPIVNANPSTIKDTLRELIRSPAERQRISRASRAYFLQCHSAEKVAEVLVSEYQKPTSHRDLTGVAGFLDYQVTTAQATLNAKLKAAVARGQPGTGALGPRTIRSGGGMPFQRLRHFVRIWRADGAGAAFALVQKFVARRLKF